MRYLLSAFVNVFSSVSISFKVIISLPKQYIVINVVICNYFFPHLPTSFYLSYICSEH